MAKKKKKKKKKKKLFANELYIYIYICSPRWGLSTLAKELLVANRVILSSSNEFSTQYPLSAYVKKNKNDTYALKSLRLH